MWRSWVSDVQTKEETLFIRNGGSYAQWLSIIVGTSSRDTASPCDIQKECGEQDCSHEDYRMTLTSPAMLIEPKHGWQGVIQGLREPAALSEIWSLVPVYTLYGSQPPVTNFTPGNPIPSLASKGTCTHGYTNTQK